MKRIAAFIYGVVAYFVFFGTFCYLFAFVGDVFVPKSVNTDIETPVVQALLINLGLIALFGVQHSIMARPGFKKLWTRIVPKVIERSMFVLVTSVILIFMFWQWRPIAGTVWEVQNTFASAVIWAIFALGALTVLTASFLINHFDLFGLRQVYLHLRSIDYTPLKFKERALYRLVRHPLMLGFLMAFWATPHMTVGHLVFTVGMTTYILIGIAFEERDLVRAHGQAYQNYRKRVPMLIPRPRVAKKSDVPEVLVPSQNQAELR